MTSLQAMNTELFEHFVEWLPHFGASLVVMLLFILASMVIKALISRFSRRVNEQKAQVIELIATAAKATILLIGVITSLGSMGVNVSALVASLGLSGFALSFALKDALSNLLAGIMIFIYQPFKVGQTIIVGVHEGKVTALTLRYMTLKAEGKKILIPNATLLTNSISIIDKA